MNIDTTTGLVSDFHSQTPFVKDKKPLTELPHNFADDIDNKDKPQIKDIAVESVDGQRIPINIWNIEIVGFRKEWWERWKK